MRSQLLGIAILLWLGLSAAQAQPGAEVPLWPGGAPGPPGDGSAPITRLSPAGEHILSNIQQPTITPFLPSPETATGAAVIIAPGGGHSEIWVDHEGFAVADWLRQHGVAAFVLKYRLARQKGSPYTVEETELGDMQRAIRVVRARGPAWHVDPRRVGVMGFSAGGELAALASTRYDAGVPTAADTVETLSSRPDFQALLYPAIPKDLRIDGQTPPAFLACGGDDRPDIAQGLPAVYLALSRVKVKAELHIYAGVGHGFGIRPSNQRPVADWPVLFLQWMENQGLLKH